MAVEASDLTITPKQGSGTGNPAGAASTIAKNGNNELEWKIPNARWFSTQENHCNTTSIYEIKGTVTVGGQKYDLTKVDLTVDAGPESVNGSVSPNPEYFSGRPGVLSTNQLSGEWEACFDGLGDFKRDVTAGEPNIVTLEDSQFHGMTVAEENKHVEQIESTTGNLYAPLFQVSAVKDRVHSGTNANWYKGSEDTKASAEEAFYAQWNSAVAVVSLNDKIKSVEPEFRARFESEAKTAVNATHVLKFECAYPDLVPLL